MREQRKRIPKISPTIERLVVREALRYRDMPREYLAQELKDKIEAMGEVSPAEETLKRRISDARQHEPSLAPYWTIGQQLEHPIPVEAIPRIIEIQRKLKGRVLPKEGEPPPDFVKIPVIVARWIGQLYKVVNDPEMLFVVAYAYALYVLVDQTASKGEEKTVDTGELDGLLVKEDYGALGALAEGLLIIMGDKGMDKTSKELPAIMERFRESLKRGE